MSETTEAAAHGPRAGSSVVESVRRILQRGETHAAGAATDFARLFLSKAPPEFVRERDPEPLARLTESAFRFVRNARPDRVDVEVVNPDVETDEGWYAPVTVIRTHVSERPFIVDTIREFLHGRDLAIEHCIYPILHVVRDDEGRVASVGGAREGGSAESLVHCEVPRITDPDLREELRREIERRLQDVVRATEDFQPMVDQADEVVAYLAEVTEHTPERRPELEEVQAFLRWLRDGGFVFLGYRSYDIVDPPGSDDRALVVESGSGLGILRDEAESRYATPVPLDSLDPTLRSLVEGGPLLIISKTNAESTVHRRARMDYVGVKKLDAEGRAAGEHRFVGLFTSKAYAEEAERIPILRDKLRWILDRAGAQEGTHDYKEIITIFNSMPKEELFLASAEEIGEDVRTILTSYHTDEVRVSIREDPLQRGATVMVIFPRERFSGDVRRSIERALVRRFRGDVLNYHLALGGGDQARLHFHLTAPPEALDGVEPDELEATVRERIRTWSDRLREALERVRSPDEARRLARSYGEVASPEYRAATDPEEAVRDILELEAMAADGRTVSVSFSNPDESPPVAGGERVTELKLHLRGRRLVLSDFMPILENVGLRVVAVTPFEIGEEEGAEALVYAFAVQDAEGRPLDIEARGTLLAETILAVRRGDATNDGLNALVLTAGLAWREVDVLRSYASYAFQLGAVPSRLSLPSALRKHPAVARALFELFRVKFDPEGPPDPAERKGDLARVEERIAAEMADVALLSDDRALRRLLELVDATVRTNYFRNGGPTPTRRSGGAPFLSLKLDGGRLESIVRSGSLYEVWVRSSRMEGVHLRAAKVARGGIRWSDRPDDFRTEVLGLVRTQVVKNAVIPPGGSKGGFVLLRSPDDPEDRAEEAKAQYETLMRGLLDLTDDVGPDGDPVRPEQVVCYDDPDPYLVVAADKGTARFSDTANAVAAEYGFWLGDAFASGGTHGYDHKAVGITARGGWESVKRHFREMGKDIQEEPFTVVGIGDMSGDVFGNGMLLSRRIRLVAAFDHRHVFIDPDPDPEASWRERKRLFDAGRSSWDDYDRSLLSEGGSVVPRGAKEVSLSPAARRALGLDEEVGTLDGEALVRAVLRAPVELLWNGGIGTYVKASDESHADVGDAANDAVRVDASDLRCEVVGEGGNLGFTQKARVEFALDGGRINTDAIDNAAGVALSDREVNLKILLAPAVRDERLSPADRNALLEELTDPVADLVLTDSRWQSLAISLDEARAKEAPDDFRDLVSALEKEGRIRRSEDDLPSWEELAERVEEGRSMTRPELCVLLAHAKLYLQDRLLESRLLDDEAVDPYLVEYFPEEARKAAGRDDLRGHRLRREIVASQWTNDLVDLMGATFVQRVSRDTGRPAEEVARAWLVAARLADHRAILGELEARAGGLPAEATIRWLRGLSRVLGRTTRWLVADGSVERATSEWVRRSTDELAELREVFPRVVRGRDRALFEKRVRELCALGAEKPFARNLVTLRFLDHLLEILTIARETDARAEEAAAAFYGISERLDVPWLRRSLLDRAGHDRWEQREAQALAADLARAHHRIAVRVIREREEDGAVERAADRVMMRWADDVSRFGALVDELRTDGAVGLSGLSVAVRELRSLAERCDAASA